MKDSDGVVCCRVEQSTGQRSGAYMSNVPLDPPPPTNIACVGVSTPLHAWACDGAKKNPSPLLGTISRSLMVRHAATSHKVSQRSGAYKHSVTLDPPHPMRLDGLQRLGFIGCCNPLLWSCTAYKGWAPLLRFKKCWKKHKIRV